MKFGKWSKKKWLVATVSSLGAVGLTAGAVATVVACEDYGDLYRPWGDYQLITDSGSVADKSFNEGAWRGLIQWAYDPIQNPDGKTIGFAQPSQATTALLQKGYKTAINNGAKYLVLPGFTHGAYGPGKINDVLNDYPDVRAIGIDTDASPSSKSVNQVVHAKYYTQESGFLAAIGIGLFSNSPKSNRGFKVNGNTIKVAAFGGQPYSAVTSYMDGLLQGMNLFNKYVDGNLEGFPYDANDFPELEGAKPFKFEFYYNGSAVSGLKPHFTETFDAGAAVPVVTDYLNNGVQFISAVAGPQTGDAVAAIRNKGQQGQAYVIGVDTEQSELYGKDYVIGSEMKGLAKTTYDILSIDPLTKAPKFDEYIRAQASSGGVTWFGLKNGESADPSQMYTGFAFNTDFRTTFGGNKFMEKFHDYAIKRTKDNPKGSVFLCSDGFGTYSSDMNPSDDGQKASYTAAKASFDIANCGLTDILKETLNKTWTDPVPDKAGGAA